MPKVYNMYHHNAPEGAVYVGRGSPWGNPFIIDERYDRDEVIALFQKMIDEEPGWIEKIKDRLVGKDLLCFCAPKPCHGDILLRIANGNALDETNGEV